jgi:hypothetical protein
LWIEKPLFWLESSPFRDWNTLPATNHQKCSRFCGDELVYQSLLGNAYTWMRV